MWGFMAGIRLSKMIKFLGYICVSKGIVYITVPLVLWGLRSMVTEPLLYITAKVIAITRSCAYNLWAKWTTKLEASMSHCAH